MYQNYHGRHLAAVQLFQQQLIRATFSISVSLLLHQPPSTGSTAANSVTDEQFKSRLLAQIPRGVFLPDSPLVLTERDEMRLLSILAWELRPADPVKLRDVYLDITNTVDKQLFGYCGYQDLFHTLSRMNVSIKFTIFQSYLD